MYGTLQPPARPMARLGLAITLLLLALALGASMVIVGSRLPGLLPNDGLRGAAVIPQGGEAVLAYADFAMGDGNGDVYTIRADGTDRRHVARGFDPTWSPDGSTIAFYSNPGTTGWDLMVADATGVRTLAAQIGCGSTELSPLWSTDSRFVVYPVYQGASADCYANATDMNRVLNVIRADSSGTAHPLLVPGSWTGSSAEWSPSGRSIVLETGSATDEGFGIADIVDPDAPWGLTLREISKPATDKGWSWPRWSADESLIATSVVAPGSDTWDAILIAADGSSQHRLWSGSEDDAVPEWAPGGKRLSLLVKQGPGGYSEGGPYDGYLVNPDGSNPQRIDAPALSGSSYGLRFSPDGTRIVGAAPVPAAGTSSPWNLYVVTLDGGAPLLTLTTGAATAGSDIPSATSWQPVVNPRSPLAWAEAASAVASPAP